MFLAIKIGTELHDRRCRDESTMQNERGDDYFSKEEWSNAIKAYNEAIALRNQIKQHNPEDHRQLALYYRNLGFTYDWYGDKQAALIAFNDAIREQHLMRERTQEDDRNLAEHYEQVGALYEELNLPKKALAAHKSAASLRNEMQQDNGFTPRFC
jgi:tetratricopeptide (TPR) repeat protein